MAEPDYQGPERRKFKRLKKPFSLRIRVQAGGDLAQWDIVLVKDISRLGLSFHYDKPLKEGTLLNLRVNFGLERGTIECVGKVVRVRPVENTHMHDIGVVFLDIRESDSDLINQAAIEFYTKLVQP